TGAGRNGCGRVGAGGGRVVEGKSGSAREPGEPQPLQIDAADVLKNLAQARSFGLAPVEKAPGRTVEPMNWMNATFAALMTCGERHLRRRMEYANATETRLNLGDFDWTVEFWFLPT